MSFEYGKGTGNTMADNKYTMSQERLDELTKELEYLENVRTREVAELIKEARSFGDLSENSEYDEAKTEQGKLYSHIAEVKDLVEHAIVIEMEHGDGAGKVVVGNKVTVEDMEDGSREVYQIVGTQEADPREGRISNDSPLGRALLGHRAGDVAEVEAPVGTLRFKILEIMN